MPTWLVHNNAASDAACPLRYVWYEPDMANEQSHHHDAYNKRQLPSAAAGGESSKEISDKKQQYKRGTAAVEGEEAMQGYNYEHPQWG